MHLTPEQQALLDGSQGEVMAKVVKTLVMYGETFGAERMTPVTSTYGHTVISFGLGVMKPIYDLYDTILDAGIPAGQKFTADPRPLDPNVPASALENLVFKRFMYNQQARYEAQLKRLGVTGDDGYTCACYFDEVGNTPKRGDVLSWAESSAVVYANSVIGARCNRNSGIIELMGSIAGFVPEFGLLTDEGRKATWVVELRCKTRPEPQLLGSAIGMKVMEDVPYIRGLDKWLGTELNDAAKDYLKDFGAATASNGAVGLYHIENLTPEAKDLGEDIIAQNAKSFVVDDMVLEQTRKNYPVIWKDPDVAPKLCFVGCPHMSLSQLKDWTDAVEAGLKESGRDQVAIPTVFTAPVPVIKEFEKTPYAARLSKTGVVVSYICPLMYMNNPLCKSKAVITSSNKLRTYTSARYYTEADILKLITGKEAAK